MRGEKTGSLARLPKWAQLKIEILERQLKDANEKLRLRGENKPTRVKVSPYSDTPYYLPEREHIEFTLKETKHGERAEIEVRLDGDRVYVYANTVYGENLAFVPKSSNTGFLVMTQEPDWPKAKERKKKA